MSKQLCGYNLSFVSLVVCRLEIVDVGNNVIRKMKYVLALHTYYHILYVIGI